jgi:methyl coenzyme M reductase subunit D
MQPEDINEPPLPETLESGPLVGMKADLSFQVRRIIHVRGFGSDVKVSQPQEGFVRSKVIVEIIVQPLEPVQFFPEFL